jgi:hypothetical protein
VGVFEREDDAFGARAVVLRDARSLRWPQTAQELVLQRPQLRRFRRGEGGEAAVRRLAGELEDLGRIERTAVTGGEKEEDRLGRELREPLGGLAQGLLLLLAPLAGPRSPVDLGEYLLP